MDINWEEIFFNKLMKLIRSVLLFSVLVLFIQSAFSQDRSLVAKEQMHLDVGLGWENLKVGAVQMGGKYSYETYPLPLVEPLEQQDGKLEGPRLDILFSRPLELSRLNGMVSLKGFYARFRDASTRVYTSISSANSDGVPLFDPNVLVNNTLGSNDDPVSYQTVRRVQHWGLALELVPTSVHMLNFQQRFGISYKAIYQGMKLGSIWAPEFENYQHYDEILNTGYLGAYWGLGGQQALFAGIDLMYGAEIGSYWARTHYNGDLDQKDFSGRYSQHLGLYCNKGALIEVFDLALKKQFNTFALSTYVRGEYYSYAPEMAYNQTNHGGGGGDPDSVNVYGPNTTTYIDKRRAYDFTVGMSLSMPLNV